MQVWADVRRVPPCCVDPMPAYHDAPTAEVVCDGSYYYWQCPACGKAERAPVAYDPETRPADGEGLTTVDP